MITLVSIMTAGSALAWLLTSLVAPELSLAVLLGIAAPLVVVTTNLIQVERAYRRDPSQVTPLMLKAFLGKMLFFGAYIALMLGVLAVPTGPFIISFTASFIVLYGAEAFRFRRLFAAAVASLDATPS